MQETTAMVFIAISRGLACMACVGVAGWLAYSKLEGWGWFLFVAVILGAYSVSFKD